METVTTVVLMIASGIIGGALVYYITSQWLYHYYSGLDKRNSELYDLNQALLAEAEAHKETHVSMLTELKVLAAQQPKLQIRLYDPTIGNIFKEIETDNLETGFMFIKESMGKWDIRVLLKYNNRPTVQLMIETHS